MIKVSTADLDAILARIDGAVGLHDKWRDGFQRNLICQLPPASADLRIDAHQHCAFGTWLYGRANAQVLSLPAMKSIEMKHREMHAKARKIYERKRAENMTFPVDYDSYQATANTLREELLVLKERAAFMLQNIDPVTGAYRQASLLPRLRADMQRQESSAEACSLLLLDLDLKAIGARLGQSLCNEVLQSAIAALREVLTPRDEIYRMAGAEFAICLPGRAVREVEQFKGRLSAVIGAAVAKPMKRIEAVLPVRYRIIEVRPDACIERLLDKGEWLSHTIELPERPE